MKIAIVKISEVAKGSGCMSALRFTDGCWECKAVLRCRNEQAVQGRVDLYERRQKRLQEELERVHKSLEEAKNERK